MVEEIMCSKAALYSSDRINATTYTEIDFNYFEQTLEDNGLDRYGNENFCHPDGTPLEMQVYFGLCTIQALRHHVKDKVQLRERGNIKPISHQPVSGRDREGGLRMGEMERDAFIEHGASAIVNERLMRVSDSFKTVYCINCGNIAIHNLESKLHNQSSCKFCDPKVAKFGTLTVPFILILILRMLESVGITFTLDLKEIIKNYRGEELFLA